MKMIRFKDVNGRSVALAPQLVAMVGECGITSGCDACTDHPKHWYVACAVAGTAWAVTKQTALRVIRDRDRAFDEGNEWKHGIEQ